MTDEIYVNKLCDDNKTEDYKKGTKIIIDALKELIGHLENGESITILAGCSNGQILSATNMQVHEHILMIVKLTKELHDQLDISQNQLYKFMNR